MIHPVLFFVGKELYVEYVGLLYVLLFAIFLYALSMVPHYGLYAMSEDRSIIVSHVVSLVAFVVLAALVTVFFPIYGVPLSLCGSFVIMLIYKSVAYSKMKKKLAWDQEGKGSIGSKAV